MSELSRRQENFISKTEIKIKNLNNEQEYVDI